MKNLNLVGIVNQVIASSTFSFEDINNDTTTGIFILDFTLSKKDKDDGYNLNMLYLYDSPYISNSFPDDPLDCLKDSKLKGVCENSIIVIKGPLYCYEIGDFDGWSNYPLTNESKPFPNCSYKHIFGTPFQYPSVIPKDIPSLKIAKMAKGFIDAALILDESTVSDDFQNKLLDDLKKYSIDKIKKRYFETEGLKTKIITI